MDEPAKVRLVRCPKCENLLPELEDYSVYQCGGCGAVLRAKNRSQKADSSSKNSEEERVEVDFAELQVSSEKEVVTADLMSSSVSTKQEVNVLEENEAERCKTNSSETENGRKVSTNKVEAVNAKGRVRETSNSEFESMSGSHASGRVPDWDRQWSSCKQPSEGMSNLYSDSSYDYRNPLRNPNEANPDQCFVPDRAELLRKLDELKEQLSQSCNLIDKQKERAPSNGRVFPPDPYNRAGIGTSGLYGGSDPFYGLNQNAHQFPEPFPYTDGHNCSYRPLYGDPFGVQMQNRNLNQLPYFSRQYVDTSPNLFEPYPRNQNAFHHHSCSCFRCYENTRAPIPRNKRYNPLLYPHENRMAFDPYNHNNPRTAVPPPPSGAVRFRHQNNALARGGARVFRPVAGGAPFVTCHNCFELLQVPKEALLMVKKQHKLRCGACSTVINFAVVDKKLVSIIDGKGRVNRAHTNFSSDDYDNSPYDFQSMEGENIEYQTHEGHSPSLSESEDEGSSPNSLVLNSVQSPIEPLAGSPLEEHFDYSSVKRAGTGNQSSRSEQDKPVVPKKVNTRQNSLKEATEMDMSFNEYTGVSHDSDEINRKVDQTRTTNKGGESFFSNIIKKSFKDFTKSAQTENKGKNNIFVNGQPLTERMAKKAEKVAGPIQPGNYWYDYRAGFWGVMGGPCLGIIPPYIEELNYPMPENCAGGTTRVYVNRRELHETDLNLLGSRGLPTDKDRSYIVDISGRVLDEDTGEELDSLGKLAPTVERVKHGFGMKAPRMVG